MNAPARSLWHALPKPVIFGICGALGGLIGATAFGEAAWWLLRPAGTGGHRDSPIPRRGVAGDRSLSRRNEPAQRQDRSRGI